MIIDTSVLLSFFNHREPSHAAVVAAIEQSNSALIVSPYVIAETDHLVLTRLGRAAETTVLRELFGGAWLLAEMTTSLRQQALSVLEKYADHDIGLTDASLIVLADDYQDSMIATLDRRHFSFLRLADGRAPALLP